MNAVSKHIVLALTICHFLLGCFGNKEKTIHKGDFDLVGHFMNDTILNGAVKFYDKSQKLVAIRTYSNDILNGYSTTYHSNGNTHDSVIFINNSEIGFNYIFDSLGHLIYKANYFYGKQMGPVFTYSANKIVEYSFNNFEGDILYFYSYDTATKKEYYPSDKFLIKAGTTEVSVNGKDGITIFLYIFTPPHLRLKYKICQLDFENKIVDSLIIPQSKFYYETFYNKPGNNSKLAIVVNKYDSLTQKENVIMEYLKTSYP